MKKILINNKGRKLLCTSIILLSILSLSVASVSALRPALNVDPDYVEVPQVGETCTINITVTDVLDLFAYELKLYYDNTILEGLEAEIPEDHFLAPEAGGIFMPIECKIYQDEGYVSVAGTLLAPEPGKNGSGTLATVTFNGTKEGLSALEFGEKGVDVIMMDSIPEEIPPDTYDLNDGSVKVIPEFPAALIAPLFLIATLLAIIFVKTALSKKRLGPPLAT